MKNIYICHTQYHLLISLIKCINDDNDNYLILCSDCDNASVINDDIIENLRKAELFTDIVVLNNVNYEKFDSLIKKLKKIKYMKNYFKTYNINLRDYDNVYIFNDTVCIGRALTYNKIKYHLLEDGTDCFKLNKNLLKNKCSLKNLIKKLFFDLGPMGSSKYVIDIEINDSENLNIFNKKIVENNKNKFLNNISEDKKKLIYNIFLGEKNFDKYNNYSLIITQPLSEDKLINGEITKVNLYQEIIQKYCDRNDFLIKTHPREITDYYKYFNDDNILNITFPLEVLNYNSKLKFDKVITISSTSINLINNCNEKIYLGWEYLEKYKGDKVE